MSMRAACPHCGSAWAKRNGHMHTGTQNHRGKLCGRAFVRSPDNPVITEEQRTLIERLLLERISRRGICRAVGGGRRWLLQFMVERFQAAPAHLYVRPPAGTPGVLLPRLEAAVDELWSLVGKQATRHWLWLALDATTRQVIACHGGDRRGQSAEAVGEQMPTVDQERALFSTDQDEVYTGGIPSAQPRALSKLARRTTHGERCNCTLRQRVSRLGRAMFSFSKNLANHSGAIKYFICDYNLSKCAALPG